MKQSQTKTSRAAEKSQNEVDDQMKLKFTAQQTKIFIFISDSCLAVIEESDKKKSVGAGPEKKAAETVSRRWFDCSIHQ